MSGSCLYCLDCGKSIGWIGRCVPCAAAKTERDRADADAVGKLESPRPATMADQQPRVKTHIERTHEEVRRWQVFGDAQRTVDHALDLARMLDAATEIAKDEKAFHFDVSGTVNKLCAALGVESNYVSAMREGGAE